MASLSTTVDQTPAQGRGIAPVWHTAVLVVFVLLISAAGAISDHHLANAHRILGYLETTAMEVLMVAYVYWGLRRRGLRMRDIVGERWRSPEQFLIDLGIAFGAWMALIVVQAVAGLIALKLHWLDMNKAQEMRKALEFLLPRTTPEIIMFAVLCVAAGVCEEIIFRGYFQKQIAAWISSLWLGTAISALLFALAHGYQGPLRMGIIALIGFVLGIVANLRRNLRPGMMTHAWFDFCSGVLFPRLAKALEHLKPGM
jgi:membrane protease YdiL (CAAX protease family)